MLSQPILVRLTFVIALGVAVSLCTPALAQYHPVPGRDATFVNYEITPLPAVAEEVTAPILPLPSIEPLPVQTEAIEAPPADAPAPEEVKPVEPTGGDAEKNAGVKTEIEKTELEIEVDEDNAYWELWRMWEVGFELGLNGAAGNSNTSTWWTAIRTKRETEWSKLTADMNYKRAMQDDIVTAERLYFEWRAEFPFQNCPWSSYVHGTVEFDEFKAFDVRVTDDGGVGYTWVKNDIATFTTRAGAGASREFGGPQDNYVPEGVVGGVYERKISKRQKISFSSEFFFDWRNPSENRANSKANWELILDEVAHLSLKVGINDRYDSTPDGKKPNDIDYSTVLLWSF